MRPAPAMPSHAAPACPITGLLLAGGRGTRMGGVDKGLQPLRGEPLALHVLRRLAPQVDALVISANRHFDAYATISPRASPPRSTRSMRTSRSRRRSTPMAASRRSPSSRSCAPRSPTISPRISRPASARCARGTHATRASKCRLATSGRFTMQTLCGTWPASNAHDGPHRVPRAAPPLAMRAFQAAAGTPTPNTIRLAAPRHR